MNNDLLRGTCALVKGSIRRVQRPRGQRVECVSGVLWVTQDGDRRDVILQAGDGFDFDRPSGAVLSALDDSRYLLLEACATPGH